MDITVIGTQIASLRKEKGVKQEDLANYIGVTAQAVSKWENGGAPDIELLPKIADFFGVSIDTLFSRHTTDYSNIKNALAKNIIETSPDERYKLVLEYCWDMERALFGHIPQGTLEEYQNEVQKSQQMYSTVMGNYGFTRMGLGNRLQYFMIVPEIEDTESAFFNGINYISFFKDFSDEEVFNACVFLNKRDAEKAFTPGLLVKNMEISFDRALEIINILKKYNLISVTNIELDDTTQEVYKFIPTPSFTAMLIFAREMIDTPNSFKYYSGGRTKPYFK